MSATGATYEPVKRGLPIVTMRERSQCSATGVAGPSVMPNVGTPLSRALMAASTDSRRHRPEADDDQQIVLAKDANLVSHISRAADRRLGAEAERYEGIGEQPRQRCGEIDPHYENVRRLVNLFGEIRHPVGVEALFELRHVVEIAIEAAGHVVGDGSPLFRFRLQHRVGRDARKEVPPEIGGEIGKAIVAQCLDRPYDRRRVHVEQFGQLSRRQKESLVRPFQDGLDQLVPSRSEPVPVLFKADVEGNRGPCAHAAEHNTAAISPATSVAPARGHVAAKPKPPVDFSWDALVEPG